RSRRRSLPCPRQSPRRARSAGTGCRATRTFRPTSGPTQPGHAQRATRPRRPDLVPRGAGAPAHGLATAPGESALESVRAYYILLTSPGARPSMDAGASWWQIACRFPWHRSCGMVTVDLITGIVAVTGSFLLATAIVALSASRIPWPANQDEHDLVERVFHRRAQATFVT